MSETTNWEGTTTALRTPSVSDTILLLLESGYTFASTGDGRTPGKNIFPLCDFDRFTKIATSTDIDSVLMGRKARLSVAGTTFRLMKECSDKAVIDFFG